MSCSCSSRVSNSDKSRWKLSEQTMIKVCINLVQHTQCSNMTLTKQRQESLVRAKPGHRIHLQLKYLNMVIGSRPPHRRTILKDWKNKCIAATKQHRGVHKDTLQKPQNTNSLRDAGDNTIIIIIIIKKYWQCKAGRGRLPPYQSEDPSPTLPTYRGKEEKGKIVEDKKVESN